MGQRTLVIGPRVGSFSAASAYQPPMHSDWTSHNTAVGVAQVCPCDLRVRRIAVFNQDSALPSGATLDVTFYKCLNSGTDIADQTWSATTATVQVDSADAGDTQVLWTDNDVTYNRGDLMAIRVEYSGTGSFEGHYSFVLENIDSNLSSLGQIVMGRSAINSTQTSDTEQPWGACGNTNAENATFRFGCSGEFKQFTTWVTGGAGTDWHLDIRRYTNPWGPGGSFTTYATTVHTVDSGDSSDIVTEIGSGEDFRHDGANAGQAIHPQWDEQGIESTGRQFSCSAVFVSDLPGLQCFTTYDEGNTTTDKYLTFGQGKINGGTNLGNVERAVCGSDWGVILFGIGIQATPTASEGLDAGLNINGSNTLYTTITSGDVPQGWNVDPNMGLVDLDEGDMVAGRVDYTAGQAVDLLRQPLILVLVDQLVEPWTLTPSSANTLKDDELGHWDLDEASGDRVNSYGSGIDITLPAGNDDPGNTTGLIGSAVQTDSTNDEIMEIASPGSNYFPGSSGNPLSCYFWFANPAQSQGRFITCSPASGDPWNIEYTDGTGDNVLFEYRTGANLSLLGPKLRLDEHGFYHAGFEMVPNGSTPTSRVVMCGGLFVSEFTAGSAYSTSETDISLFGKEQSGGNKIDVDMDELVMQFREWDANDRYHHWNKAAGLAYASWNAPAAGGVTIPQGLSRIGSGFDTLGQVSLQGSF